MMPCFLTPREPRADNILEIGELSGGELCWRRDLGGAGEPPKLNVAIKGAFKRSIMA